MESNDGLNETSMCQADVCVVRGAGSARRGQMTSINGAARKSKLGSMEDRNGHSIVGLKPAKQ